MGIHPMMKFLSFVVLVLLSFTLSSLAQECSGPCNPAFPTCQLSTCEGDVCVTSTKLPVPEGCCTRTTDCLLLNDDDDDCTYECDFETNQCVISECNEPLASGRCNSDRDCDDKILVQVKNVLIIFVLLLQILQLILQNVVILQKIVLLLLIVILLFVLQAVLDVFTQK